MSGSLKFLRSRNFQFQITFVLRSDFVPPAAFPDYSTRVEPPRLYVFLSEMGCYVGDFLELAADAGADKHRQSMRCRDPDTARGIIL